MRWHLIHEHDMMGFVLFSAFVDLSLLIVKLYNTSFLCLCDIYMDCRQMFEPYSKDIMLSC